MTPLLDLFKSASDRHFPKGQIILYEGDPVNRLYQIDEGFVKVYNILANGTERIIFIYGPGDMFPLTSYLSGFGVARYFYECMKEAKVKVMNLAIFENKIKGKPELAQEMIKYSYLTNQQFVQRIDMLSVNDTRRKIISLLAFLLAKAGDKSGKLNLALTSKDFADLAGVTRETVSVQLNKLRRDGLISGNHQIMVDINHLNKLKIKYSIPKFA